MKDGGQQKCLDEALLMQKKIVLTFNNRKTISYQYSFVFFFGEFPWNNSFYNRKLFMRLNNIKCSQTSAQQTNAKIKTLW